MEKNTRFRINLSTRELEVEGSEDFVREYAEKFKDVIKAFSGTKSLTPMDSVPQNSVPVQSQSQTGQQNMPEVFGAYFQQFPRETSDIDKVLIAAYYTQMYDDKNIFSTVTANKHLKLNGIKVANASQAVKNQINAKRVFSVSSGKYRVSQAGIEYLAELQSK